MQLPPRRSASFVFSPLGIHSKDASGGAANDKMALLMMPVVEECEDTDEEEDRRVPLPCIVSQANGRSTNTEEEEDLSWMAVPPPLALTTPPRNTPEPLRRIIESSVENVKQLAASKVVQKWGQDDDDETGRAAMQAETSGRSTKRAPAGIRLLPPDHPVANIGISKGKGKAQDNSTYRIPPAVGLRRLRPPSSSLVTAKAASSRHPSRAFGLPHIYVSNDSGSGGGKQDKSSAAGTAAAQLVAAVGRSKRVEVNAPQTWVREISVNHGPAMHIEDTTASETIECIACLEDIAVKEAIKTTCHSYCKACFRQLVRTALQNDALFPPKCCLNEVPAETMRKHLPPGLRSRYMAKVEEFALPANERLYCPTVDCGVFIMKSQITQATHRARCRNGHETCSLCRRPTDSHGGGRCPEDRDQQMTDALADVEGWRRCIRCDVLIEHREACQHMTCRCGAEFCYVCRAPWRTCSCSMEDLDRLKRKAADRRARREIEERAAAERAEEEQREQRETLQLIEQFERAQARRRQQRRAVLRPQLEQLRKRREESLRAEVEAKYAGLRSVLARLEDEQPAAARRQRRAERVAGARERAKRLAALEAEWHDAAAAEADVRSQAAKREWDRDYQVRAYKLKKAYEAQVTAVSARVPADGAIMVVDAYMCALYNDYLKRRGDALAAEWFCAETRALREKHGAVLLRAETQQRAAAEQQRRHAAERMWCRVLVAVWKEQLAMMEAAEIELSLAGSTATADAILLLLLEMDARGAGQAEDVGSSEEVDNLYRIVLGDAVMDGLDGSSR